MSDLLADRFAARAAEVPGAVAVRDGAGQLTYAELRARVDAAARALSGYRRVAVLPRSDADALAVVLGAMAAGTCIVLLDRHLTAAQAERLVAVARPGLVVAARGRPQVMIDRVPAEAVRTPEELIAEGERRPAARRAEPGDELLVGLTSGTTGRPKLFSRVQASWATTLDRSDRTFDVRPGDVVSTSGSLDHGHFFYGALHALTRGATADLRPLATAFADGGAVSHVYLVPPLAVDLVEVLDGRPCAAVREVVSSAAPWHPHARERLARLLPAATISHFYGASELSYVSLSSSRDEPPTSGAGRPFDGVEIEIRDASGRRLPDGEQGEVHVRSDMLFCGYLTEDGCAGGPDAEGWFCAGDVGTLSDGWLSIAGRTSEMFISGGFNVQPGHVERVLADLPGVTEAACVGLPDERWGAIPAAVLVLDGAHPVDRAGIRAHARSHLPQPSRPRRVFILDALPRNPHGKLDRPELLARIGPEARELV